MELTMELFMELVTELITELVKDTFIGCISAIITLLFTAGSLSIKARAAVSFSALKTTIPKVSSRHGPANNTSPSEAV